MQLLNNKNYKIIITFIMVFLMLFSQCVLPIIQAHAIVTELITALGLGALLVSSIALLSGLKILPSNNKSAGQICEDIYRSIASSNNKTSSFIQDAINKSKQPGDKLQISTTDLQTMKSEISSALNIDTIDTSGEISVSSFDVVYTSTELYSNFNVSPGNTLTVDFPFNSYIVLNTSAYGYCSSDSVYYVVNAIKIYRTESDINNNRYSNKVYGNVYKYDSTYGTYNLVKEIDTSPSNTSFGNGVYDKIQIQLTSSGKKFGGSLNCPIIGKDTDAIIYLANSSGTSNTFPSAYYKYPSYYPAQTRSDITGEIYTYESDITTTGVKQIGGVTSSIINAVNSSGDGSDTLEITIPSVINPTVNSLNSGLGDVIIDGTGVNIDNVTTNVYDPTTAAETDTTYSGEEYVIPKTDGANISDIGTNSGTSDSFPDSIVVENNLTKEQIRDAVSDGISDALDGDQLKDAISDGISDALSGNAIKDAVKAGVDSSLGSDADMPEVDDLTLPEIITTKFPFSIPWDIKRAINIMTATAQVPEFDIPFEIESIGFSETIHISLEQFEVIAIISRWFCLVGTVFGLIIGTRKFIGQ